MLVSFMSPMEACVEPRAAHSKSLASPGPDTSEDSERPELVDATRYDLDRLERAVSELAQQYAQMRDDNATLNASLDLRDARIQELESNLESLGQRRRTAIERVDRLVAELDRLDSEFDGEATA